MRGRARSRAADVFEQNLETFTTIGWSVVERPRALDARLAGDSLPLRMRMHGEGRIFGGTFALEVATADPVLPATRGLRARGRGIVKLARVSFDAQRGDAAGSRLAAALEQDPSLQRALASVDFERIRVEPDGRAVIRHLGGSVVWALFPPFVRAVPLVDPQARATVDALAAFAAVAPP